MWRYKIKDFRNAKGMTSQIPFKNALEIFDSLLNILSFLKQEKKCNEKDTTFIRLIVKSVRITVIYQRFKHKQAN